jgi:hypothetical protein
MFFFHTKAKIIRGSTVSRALQHRGVRVWLDKDEIRPGDRFVWALEHGLETSRAVALVVTAESLNSGWVADEYSRAVALSNEGRLQLIPIVLRDAKLPGFLSNRQHVDFREPSVFDQAVDRLVWPGITGKRVIWYPVFGVSHSERWKRLLSVAREERIELAAERVVQVVLRVLLEASSATSSTSRQPVPQAPLNIEPDEVVDLHHWPLHSRAKSSTRVILKRRSLTSMFMTKSSVLLANYGDPSLLDAFDSARWD